MGSVVDVVTIKHPSSTSIFYEKTSRTVIAKPRSETGESNVFIVKNANVFPGESTLSKISAVMGVL